jgi:flagellin-like hook-associated protein FlgL
MQLYWLNISVFYIAEKLANTERYVDQGKLHALRAEDKTDELKKLNRSIFRPAITFNKDAKRTAQEAKVAARYDEERSNRERAMGDVRESQNRLGQAVSYGARRGEEAEDEFGEEGISRRRIRPPEEQRHRQESRKRYQFEKTASDDELEDELDDNLDDIAQATKSLKAIAMAAGEELDRQNDRIDNIATKTGKLNNRVDLTTNRVCAPGIRCI